MGVEGFGDGLGWRSVRVLNSVFPYIVGKTACCRTHLRIQWSMQLGDPQQRRANARGGGGGGRAG